MTQSYKGGLVASFQSSKNPRYEILEINGKSLPDTNISNEYIRAATSENTRKAYRSDIRHFQRWGGLLPATSDSVIVYLQEHASILNPRTLARRLTKYLRTQSLFLGQPSER